MELIEAPTRTFEVESALAGIRVRAVASNEPVAIDHLPPGLRLIGYGTDAVAVQHPLLPEHVFKVFTPETVGCLDDEYRAYQALDGSPFFPRCLGRGPSYLVLSYEAGPTLYECLVHGLPVDPRVMADVEEGRVYARRVGLHPKDIHLKNVVVQGDRAKILDVAKYVAAGDEDPVWEHLAEGYRRFYPIIRGRRIPVWVIEVAKRTYRAQPGDQFSFDLFAGQMLRVLRALRIVGPVRGRAA